MGQSKINSDSRPWHFSVIDSANHPDFCQIVTLDRGLGPSSWKEDQWREIFLPPQNHRYRLWSCKETLNGPVAAFLLSWSIPEDHLGHILKLFVAPEKRRKKLAFGLFRHSLEDLHLGGLLEIYLEVEEKNESALAFYRSMGLAPIRPLKNFYGRERDGLALMAKIRDVMGKS